MFYVFVLFFDYNDFIELKTQNRPLSFRKELDQGIAFCPECGAKLSYSIHSQPQKEVKVMLDPSEVVPHKETADSSKTMSGQGKTIGLILMMISIVADVACMFLIGFDAFIPVTIGATVLFVIGFFIRMFSP